MKIVCVAGGSYKSFYINYAVKLRKCDLLIFNFGILYDYNIKEEVLGNAVLTNELLALSKKLNCTIVAGVFVVNNKERKKAIIVCDKDKIHLSSLKYGARIYVNNREFVAGDRNTNYLNFNKIVLTDKRLDLKLSNCSKRKLYIFCDKYGVNFVINKKMERKFCKYSKIILK